MAEGLREDDFLVPSLDRRHNVKRIKRAWDPAMVVWASFFVGPFGAAFLIWMNGVQLRASSWKWCAPILGFLSYIVLLYLALKAVGGLTSPLDELVPPYVLVIVTRLAWVGLTYWATRAQNVRFKIYSAEDGKESNIILYGVGAYLLNSFGVKIVLAGWALVRESLT